MFYLIISIQTSGISGSVSFRLVYQSYFLFWNLTSLSPTLINTHIYPKTKIFPTSLITLQIVLSLVVMNTPKCIVSTTLPISSKCCRVVGIIQSHTDIGFDLFFRLCNHFLNIIFEETSDSWFWQLPSCWSD